MRRPHQNQKRSLILPVLLVSLSTRSLAFIPSLNTRSSSPSSLLSSTSNDSTTTSYTAPLNSGRFGHASLYLPPPLNQVLLLGGQLTLSNSTSSSSEPITTNSILQFNLASSYLYGSDRPTSAIPNNPFESTLYSSNFQPTSFVASGVDYGLDLLYLIGGTTEGDCSSPSSEDSIIQSFNLTSPSSSWTSPSFLPRLPPRRRQAQLLTTSNSSTLSTDLWVLGGISDPSSCSLSPSPLGYLGIDHYSPLTNGVESFKWQVPEGWEGDVPVSDYSSEVLDDGTSLVVFGGQTTEGEMVALEKVLVFNTETREWYAKNVTGDIPPSRMGQISLTLASSNSSLAQNVSSPILVHGGLSPSSNATESIYSDTYLLVPPPRTDLSPFSREGEWIWKKLVISNDSMLSPQLAYHAASQVLGRDIIVSFGITSDQEAGEEKVSEQIWFLSVDIEQGTFSWKDTWEGNSAALADEGVVEDEKRRLRRKRGLIVEPIEEVAGGTKSMVKRVEIIANPKAYSIKQTASSSSIVPVETAQGGTWSGQQQAGSGIESQAEPQFQTSSVPSPPSSSSSKIIVQSPSSSPLASSPKSHASSSSPSSTTLGASIGGTLGALALLSVAIVLIRRSRNSRSKIPDTPQMMNSSFSGPNSGGGPPLVSSLMYTRPLHTRQLSLGSTISELPSPAPTASTVRAIDPFSDEYNVNELGQLSRQSSISTTRGIAGVGVGVLSRPAPTRDGGGPRVLERSKSSVTSIPFLSTIALHPSSPLTPSRDSYTSPARTLSMRRTSGIMPPVPGTPVELIGLAVTSDDGHDAATYGLPYRAPSFKGQGGKEGEGWENFLRKKQGESGNGLGVGEGEGEGEGEEDGIPAILRPATPKVSKGLKVRNADPFVDQ